MEKFTDCNDFTKIKLMGTYLFDFFDHKCFCCFSKEIVLKLDQSKYQSKIDPNSDSSLFEEGATFVSTAKKVFI